MKEYSTIDLINCFKGIANGEHVEELFLAQVISVKPFILKFNDMFFQQEQIYVLSNIYDRIHGITTSSSHQHTHTVKKSKLFNKNDTVLITLKNNIIIIIDKVVKI